MLCRISSFALYFTLVFSFVISDKNMSSVQELKMEAESLGLSDSNIVKYVTEQQKVAREERAEER